MVAEFRRRRELIVAGMNRIQRVHCATPAGAFYVFPNIQALRRPSAEIAARLLNEAGIASERLSSVGYGATRPVANNATDQGRRKNRRVEVVLYAPPQSPEGLQTPQSPAQTDLGGTATLSRVQSPTRAVPNGLSPEPAVDSASAPSPVATAPAESQPTQGSGSPADQPSGGTEPASSESVPDAIPVDRSEPVEPQSADTAPNPAP